MFKFNDKINCKDGKNDVLTIGEILTDMISAEYSENFDCNTYNKFSAVRLPILL